MVSIKERYFMKEIFSKENLAIIIFTLAITFLGLLGIKALYDDRQLKIDQCIAEAQTKYFNFSANPVGSYGHKILEAEIKICHTKF
jgi:hypothetical protein